MKNRQHIIVDGRSFSRQDQTGATPLTPISHVEAARPLAPMPMRQQPQAGALVTLIRTALDDAKAEDIVSIDLVGKSSIADAMVVATGRSDRHVGSAADRVVKALKDQGIAGIHVEGAETCEWVLIDAGDVIVHVFKPEARSFYNIEKLWSADRPKDGSAA